MSSIFSAIIRLIKKNKFLRKNVTHLEKLNGIQKKIHGKVKTFKKSGFIFGFFFAKSPIYIFKVLFPSIYDQPKKLTDCLKENHIMSLCQTTGSALNCWAYVSCT